MGRGAERYRKHQSPLPPRSFGTEVLDGEPWGHDRNVLLHIFSPVGFTFNDMAKTISHVLNYYDVFCGWVVIHAHQHTGIFTFVNKFILV